MASLDVIKRLTFRAQAEGFEDTARKFESLGKAEEGLIAASERIEKSSGRVESSFRRIQGSLDPAAKATQQFESTLKGIRAAQEQGITTQTRGNELIELAEKRAIAAATATERFAEAHKGLSAQSQAALHSIRSVAEQVALGISPVQALTGQFNHLSFAATGEGGLKGAFTGLGPVLTSALRFINPVTVGLTAVAGAALAANRALDQQREERVATTSGLGRFGQATAADVGAIANRAAGNGVSIGQAREAVLAFTRAGVESNEVIERGTGLVQRYATTVGGDFADAQKDLAKLAAEPAKAIDAIAAITGIDAEVANHVKLLDSLGNKTGAAKEAFDALDKALVRDADASTDAGRARAYLLSQLTKGLDVAGRLALFQEPTPDTGAGKRAAEQAAAITRPGFARALPGEIPRGADAEAAAIDAMQATATAKALDEVSRSAKRRELVQKGVNEEIRKGTEAHQLDLAAIHAHTAEEQAGVAMTRTYLAAVKETGNDEIARARATEDGEKVLSAHNQQQEDAVRIGKANVDVIRALGGEQLKAAVYAQALAVKTDDFAGAQAKVNDITAQQAVAERNRTLQHNANMQSITAFTQAEHEAAAGQQAYTSAIIGGASAAQASLAASQAMAEERAKDVAAARQITRAHEANMQAIVALTTEEKANAAASVAAAGQRAGSMAAAAAATAAYAEEVAKAAVVQRDFDRQLAASQGNAMREATAQLQAAQVRPGPGAQAQRGQIQATAAAQSQIATIQAQNPNIQIDTSAFVQAAQDVAALSESARQASTSLQLIQQWGQQANQLNISTDVLNGSISKADGAYRQVISSGMAQVNALGLEGDARDKATDAINRAGAAAYNNAIAQGQSQQRAAEAADLAARNVHALARDAEMASQGITSMGVALKNIVHDTTISALDANGKTLGAGVTLTGLITPNTALRLNQLHSTEAALASFQRSQGANDNSAAMAIASPVASLVDNAQSQLESARDQVKSAEDSVKSAQESAKRSAETQPMANATKSEPQLDPYLSRNASVYYGTATEAFYKEVSWQDASLNMAKESLSTDQEALNTAQQELSTAQAAYSTAQAQFNQLQSIAASANSMAAAGMSPTTIGAAVASALAGAGYAKTAQDVTTATQSYTTQATQAALTQRVEQQKASLAGTPYYPSVTSSSFNTRTTASPFTGLKDLPRFAEGGTLGAGQWGIAGESGPELIRGPAQVVPQKGGEGVTVNDYRVTHVYGVTEPQNVVARLEGDAKDRNGYSGAAMRAARLAA